MATRPTDSSSHSGQSTFVARSGGALPKHELAKRITNDPKKFQEYFGSDEGRPFLDPLDDKLAEPASWDVRVGGLACLLTEGRETPPKAYMIEPGSERAQRLVRENVLIDVQEQGQIEIRPSETCVIWTHERVALPLSLVALVTTKASMASRGLLQVTSRIDPGFASEDMQRPGHPLQIPIYNGGSKIARLKFERPFANLVFLTLSERSREGYKGGGTGGIDTADLDLSRSLEQQEPDELLKLLRNRSYEAEVTRVLLKKMLGDRGGK